jgi:AmiR/NasT family two-component response regulator
MSVVQFSPVRGMTLFIHDPEAYYARVMRTLLSAHGARLIETTTESAGLSQRCLALRPDILVVASDPGAPGSNALISAIRSGQSGLDREMRIVVSTKCAHLDYIKHLAASGADAVILKPFNGKTVLAQIERMARQRAATLRARSKQVSELRGNSFGLIRGFNSR